MKIYEYSFGFLEIRDIFVNYLYPSYVGSSLTTPIPNTKPCKKKISPIVHEL